MTRTQEPHRPSKSTRHVLMCADANFVVPLTVTLRSLSRSQDSTHPVHVTVLSLGIASEDRDRIRLSAQPLSVEFVDIDQMLPEGLPTTPNLSRAAYGRLKGIDVLPEEVERVVYLDADLLVLEDLGFLFEVPLDGCAVAAIQSPSIPFVSNRLGVGNWQALGLRPDTPCLNSGVMVIDTIPWRDRRIGDAVIDYVMKYPKHVVLADQGGLNAVLKGDFSRLPLRWNQLHSFRNSWVFDEKISSLYSRDDIETGVAHPAIVHFSSPRKPWLEKASSPATSLWWEILSETEYCDYRPSVSTQLSMARGRLKYGVKRRLNRLRRTTS